MIKKWIVRERPDQVVVKQLMKATGYEEPLATLMVQRGITTAGEAEAFFRPSFDVLHDPFLMKDMNIAVDKKNGNLIFFDMIMPLNHKYI